MRLYNLSKEFHILPFPGALLDQPDDVIKKFEVIMLVRNEDEERASQSVNQGPPEK